ncbi:MAG: hypothetical protein M3Y33_13460 [Actinomycetota bacterium]|nr:hypothetical protein [Actinomycetota bacterium]
MSSTEWSAYLHDALGVSMDPGRISDEVAARLLAMYRAHLPLEPGALDLAVEVKILGTAPPRHTVHMLDVMRAAQERFDC